jgi:hypothetical protein
MEFNDSTVRDLNVTKLKEDCYGGDQSSSNNYSGFAFSTLDGWGFGGGSGGYGKSGYMLFYERKKKKPIKLVETKKEDDKEVEEIK